jgi:hypothetical protein
MKINVNGQSFLIRANLARGLRVFWEFYATIPFWADALCIDQTNTVERSHQVNLMQDIYSYAALVIVWLGPAVDNSVRAIEIISRIASTPWENDQKWGENYEPWRSWARRTESRGEREERGRGRGRGRGSSTEGSFYLSPATREPKFADPNTRIGAYVDHMSERAIVALLERPYWGRLWIVQEILLARGIRVLCGQQSLLWHTLNSFVDVLTEISQLPGAHESYDKMRQARGFDIIAERDSHESASGEVVSRGLKMPLTRVITNFGQQECADVRDKIFGCLGLVDFKGQSPIMADYSLPAEESARQVSFHIHRTVTFGLAASLDRLCRRNLGL